MPDRNNSAQPTWLDRLRSIPDWLFWNRYFDQRERRFQHAFSAIGKSNFEFVEAVKTMNQDDLPRLANLIDRNILHFGDITDERDRIALDRLQHAREYLNILQGKTPST